MARKKQPLTFSLDRHTGSTAEPASDDASKRVGRAAVRLKQVGARITENLYRELKAHAALKGERVQTILEAMIADYLHHHRGDQNS